MTEYIDKGIAINIIEMTDHTGYSIECVTDITDLAVKAIKEMPTADVVEVVRCKDCKFRKIEFGWNGKKYKMCANTDYPTDDDAYCSYAERREDAN